MPKNYVYNKPVHGFRVDIHCFEGAKMPSDDVIGRIVDREGSKHKTNSKMVLRIFPNRYNGLINEETTFSGKLDE